MRLTTGLAGILLTFAAGMPSLFSATFTFADFSNPSGIALIQNAVVTANRLRLTGAAENQVSAAWLNDRANVQGGFVTTFQFQITERGGYPFDWEPGVTNTGADGFTFTIQNAGPTALGLYASGIGYYGIPNSLAIEFDTWNNKPSYCEPNGNHIAVQSLGAAQNRPEHCADADGAFPNPTLDIASPSKDMSDGTIYNVMITYLPGALRIYLDDLTTPLLTVNVNLATLLNLENGQDAYIGFTSSTGGAFENHDIVQWRFSNEDPIPGGDDPTPGGHDGDVPEPGTLLLAGGALIAIAIMRRR